MKTPRFRHSLAVAFVAALAAAFSPVLQALEQVNRPRVAFVPAEVTIDGVPRPDIGRAMADSFSAASLKRGNYRVFNMEPQAPPARLGKGRKSLPMLGNAVTGQVSGPKTADLDFLFSFNLIGDGDHFAFTMKKIRADTNEVLEAHELSTTGRLDRVFTLVPKALECVDARHLPPPFPVTQSPATIPSYTPPPAPAYVHAAPNGEVPLEWKNFDFSKVPKALIYRRVGSIAATVDPWRFCIINPLGSTGMMQTHDDVQVLWDNSTSVYAQLHVTGTDSGKVIANYGKNPSYHRLFPGDAVFGWAPPLQ